MRNGVIPASTPERGAEAAFAAGLLDPTVAAPADVMRRPADPAARRYDVYRNNVTVSLIDALAAIYPAVRRLTGDDFFRAMARSHVRATPPTSPLLFDYGRAFPDYVERYPHAQSLPWLADVARIERAWLDAYHAADAPVVAPDGLAAIPHDRLADVVFVRHPAAYMLRSRYPAGSIFARNRQEGPAQPLVSAAAEDTLVTRPELAVDVRVLPAGGAEFVGALMCGQTLAAAANAAFAAAAAFDLPANLAGMLAAGAFTALRLPESP
ncbi:MAG: putative DNA-binding domain-containing protein [Proteobacteria bacterium]|nr:putative DNA-binding domain-containing protein [Pseudomonadota bacterium]